LRRAIETNRNYAPAHFWLAGALAHLGRLNEARAATQVGLAIDLKRKSGGKPRSTAWPGKSRCWSCAMLKRAPTSVDTWMNVSQVASSSRSRRHAPFLAVVRP